MYFVLPSNIDYLVIVVLIRTNGNSYPAERGIPRPLIGPTGFELLVLSSVSENNNRSNVNSAFFVILRIL